MRETLETRIHLVNRRPSTKLHKYLASVLTVVMSTGCSNSITDETFAGMTVCAKVWALDIKLQTYGSEEDYANDIQELWLASNDAIKMNSDRYGQLTLLISQFKDAVETGDRRQLLDLVAVQGECENLGFAIND